MSKPVAFCDSSEEAQMSWIEYCLHITPEQSVAIASHQHVHTQLAADALVLPRMWVQRSKAIAVLQAIVLMSRSCRSLRRHRHHCRLCGEVFCQACSQCHLLLPPKFQQQQPQRVCRPCADLLEPLQPFLAGKVNNPWSMFY